MPFLSNLARAAEKAYKEKTFEAGDVECLYQFVEGRHVYAIRGTETQLFTRGGIIDLLRGLVFWGSKDIHFGFLEGWNRISKDILEHYWQQPAAPLCLTGHSMGGAIAIIGTSKLLIDGFEKGALSCVTFGAPRCIDFNGAFNDEARSDLAFCAMEVVHYRDPVPAFFRFARFSYADEPYLIGRHKRAKWFKLRFAYHGMEAYLKELLLAGR